MTELAANLGRVRDRLAAAGGAERVTLVAVAKTFGPELIAAAADAGVTDIGESYAQEFEQKLDALPDLDVRWHFVGGLQRNKVRRLAGRVGLWQSIDRAVLVDEVSKRDPGASILIQVNTTDEPQKSGCLPDETASLVARATDGGLVVEGLMTIGRQGSEDQSRQAFRRLRREVDDLGLEHCSMGMSADLELAVAEGATMVRVGRDIFGDR